MHSDNKCRFFDVQTQFLCCVPIKKVQWKEETINLSWDDQSQFLDETVRHPKLEQYPLDTNYVIRFLRHVIESLEKQNIEVHDDFYTILCDLQSKTNDNAEYSYKHYQVLVGNGDFETIILKENRNKISQGTTGLNVWESALAISDWAIQNKHLFCDKNVLEIGAGTGLSSLIISKCCTPRSIFITDGNDNVIRNLEENVSNNFLRSGESRYQNRGGGTVIGVLKLDWTQTDASYVQTHLGETDIIIAADVIYDNTLFDSLLSTLRVLFDNCHSCKQFMLVNAVRNPETGREFLTKLAKFGFQYREEECIERKFLHWEANEYSPIKLYFISNQQTPYGS